MNKGEEIIGHDSLDVARAGTGLKHGGGIDVHLKLRLATAQDVTLEIRRNVQDEGIAASIHGVVDFGSENLPGFSELDSDRFVTYFAACFAASLAA